MCYIKTIHRYSLSVSLFVGFFDSVIHSHCTLQQSSDEQAGRGGRDLVTATGINWIQPDMAMLSILQLAAAPCQETRCSQSWLWFPPSLLGFLTPSSDLSSPVTLFPSSSCKLCVQSLRLSKVFLLYL